MTDQAFSMSQRSGHDNQLVVSMVRQSITVVEGIGTMR